MPACSVRVGLIQQEIVARLKAALPGAIDAFNTREGYTGLAMVKQPKDFKPAPQVLEGDWMNTVLVSVGVQTLPIAARLFQHSVSVVIYSLGDKWTAGDVNVMRRVFERAELIQGVMHPLLNCCISASGVMLWRQLAPTGIGPMPEGYADGYAGCSITYELKATPNANAR